MLGAVLICLALVFFYFCYLDDGGPHGPRW